MFYLREIFVDLINVANIRMLWQFAMAPAAELKSNLTREPIYGASPTQFYNLRSRHIDCDIKIAP